MTEATAHTITIYIFKFDLVQIVSNLMPQSLNTIWIWMYFLCIFRNQQ